MPHKHNLDVMEILRGNVSVVIANQSLIKDIAKTLVYRLSRHRNSVSPAIPERILTRAPSA